VTALAVAAGLVVLIAALHWDGIREWLTRDRVAEILRMDDDAMPGLGMDGRWPADLCSYPPCDREDWWICDAHLPRGKHHAPPLRYSPMPPTVHDITDLREWK